MTKTQLLTLATLLLLAACNPTETAKTDAAQVNTSVAEEVGATTTELPVEMTALLDTEFSGFDGLTYYAGSVDLNGDGTEEWMAYVAGPGACGTGGCPLRIFQQTESGIETKGELSVVQLPVGVFDTSTDGWLDLAVTIGGGGAEYAVVKVTYSDPVYISNPTVAPTEASSENFTTVVAFPEM